jgi:hypothetical protein
MTRPHLCGTEPGRQSSTINRTGGCSLDRIPIPHSSPHTPLNAGSIHSPTAGLYRQARERRWPPRTNTPAPIRSAPSCPQRDQRAARILPSPQAAPACGHGCSGGCSTIALPPPRRTGSAAAALGGEPVGQQSSERHIDEVGVGQVGVAVGKREARRLQTQVQRLRPVGRARPKPPGYSAAHRRWSR